MATRWQIPWILSADEKIKEEDQKPEEDLESEGPAEHLPA